MVGAASLFGILIGAIGLGGLSDHFGRKPMFIVEMVIFIAFLVPAGLQPQLSPGWSSSCSASASRSAAIIRPPT